jgi:bromodomain-containing factor 1
LIGQAPDFSLHDPDELYLEGRRLSRSNKSRDYTADLGLAGQKTAKWVNDSLKKCDQILNMVCAHRSSEPFLYPVDYDGLRLYDYPLIVKEPMDLSTVRKKLRNRDYKNAGQFMADMRLIWQNSFLYNQKFSPIYNLTAEMSDYFEKLARELHDATTVGDDLSAGQVKPREPAVKQKDAGPKPSAKQSQPSKASLDTPLTVDEQIGLSNMIKSRSGLKRQTSTQTTMEAYGTSLPRTMPRRNKAES